MQLSYPTADGRTLPVRLLKKGDVFGGAGVWRAAEAERSGGAATRRETATAVEPCVLKAVAHERFSALVRHDSDFNRTQRVLETLVARQEATGAPPEPEQRE